MWLKNPLAVVQKSPRRGSKIPLYWLIIPLAMAQKSPCHSGPANSGRGRACRGRMVGRSPRDRRSGSQWWGEASRRAVVGRALRASRNSPKTTFRTVISRRIVGISHIAITDVPRIHIPNLAQNFNFPKSRLRWAGECGILFPSCPIKGGSYRFEVKKFVLYRR